MSGPPAAPNGRQRTTRWCSSRKLSRTAERTSSLAHPCCAGSTSEESGHDPLALTEGQPGGLGHHLLAGRGLRWADRNEGVDGAQVGWEITCLAARVGRGSSGCLRPATAHPLSVATGAARSPLELFASEARDFSPWCLQDRATSVRHTRGTGAGRADTCVAAVNRLHRTEHVGLGFGDGDGDGDGEECQVPCSTAH